ncbi:hypothetical protein Tco_0239780, partial [Tanacetum coccineum]
MFILHCGSGASSSVAVVLGSVAVSYARLNY